MTALYIRNQGAFAALKADGSVVTWGDSWSGGDSIAVASSLSSGVVTIYSNQNAFAALKADGSVVTWGGSASGGVSSAVASSLSSGVVTIYSTYSAFAALKADGSVVTWGDSRDGGYSSAVASSLSSGVVAIYSTYSAFAALKADGSVVTWGSSRDGANSSAVASSLSSGVVTIYSNAAAFAALKADGSVVTWGRSDRGGDSYAVASSLSSGVVTIYSSGAAFAALKADGSVVTWGSSSDGGDSIAVASSLSSGVVTIYSNQNAFAALKADGSVVTWGNSDYGGNSIAVAASLSSDVVSLSEPAVTFIAASSAVIGEGNSGNSGSTAYTFIVTRTGYLGQASATSWAVTGRGANPASATDFDGSIFPSGTVNFAAGQASQTITVNVTGDSTFEPDEGFKITLSAPPSGRRLGTAVALGTILNDDTSLSIGRLNASRSEGQSGTTAFTFVVTRSGDKSGPASATWAVTGGTSRGTVAANAADFTGRVLPSGVVSFAANETSKTVTVNVAGDGAVELNESFTVTLANPLTGVTIGTATAIGIIYNDDTPGTGTLSIARASAQKAEGHSGTTRFTFTVTRDGDATGTASADWSVTGGGVSSTAAANGADFAGGQLPNGRVNFAAGQTSQTVTVNVAGDAAIELDDSFTVTLAGLQAGVTLGTASATGVILNDDFPPTGELSIGRLNASRSEGQSGTTAFTFVVTRTGTTTGPASATWAVTGGTVAVNAADFTGGVLPSGVVSFAANETSKTVTVNVAGDGAVELNESFTVTLANPLTGVTIGTATATGIIYNDDTPGTGTLSIARASAQKAEGHSGTTPFTFTVTRGGDATGTASADWSVTGGGVSSTAAANGADFAAGQLPNGRVNFAAGQTSQTVTVNVAGDAAIELNDSFTVTLAGLQAGVTLGIASATGVILNDDFPPTGELSIAGLQAERGEGADGTTAFTFVVTRSGDKSGPASATWAVGGGTAGAADFAGGVMPTGTVSFAPGQASQVVTVMVAGDTLVEADESFTVTLSGVPAGVSLGTASAIGVICNDDPSGTGTVSIARASAQKPEGASGTTPFTFTVTRSGDLSGVAGVDGAVTGGGPSGTTAANGADFSGGQFPSVRISFAAGQALQTVTLDVSADEAAELNEGFTVTLSNAQAGVTIGTASVTFVIMNDDFVSTAANQTLTGTEGSDVFMLGGGLDVVLGKGGLDDFRFQQSAIGPAASNATTFEDFSRAVGERIDLSRIDAIAGNATHDMFSFIGTAAFDGTPGQLRWQDNGAVRLIQGNVNNDTVADLTIFVKAAGPVDANWFAL
jgi:hypothetical protein